MHKDFSISRWVSHTASASQISEVPDAVMTTDGSSLTMKDYLGTELTVATTGSVPLAYRPTVISAGTTIWLLYRV